MAASPASVRAASRDRRQQARRGRTVQRNATRPSHDWSSAAGTLLASAKRRASSATRAALSAGQKNHCIERSRPTPRKTSRCSGSGEDFFTDTLKPKSERMERRRAVPSAHRALSASASKKSSRYLTMVKPTASMAATTGSSAVWKMNGDQLNPNGSAAHSRPSAVVMAAAAAAERARVQKALSRSVFVAQRTDFQSMEDSTTEGRVKGGGGGMRLLRGRRSAMRRARVRLDPDRQTANKRWRHRRRPFRLRAQRSAPEVTAS